MIPIHEHANWERPFLAVQGAVDRFVYQTGRLPGHVQLALFPFAFAISMLHIPFALTHFFLLAIADRFTTRELPTLTRDQLAAWSRETHTKWVARHENLRQCNPPETADAMALPVIAALRCAVHSLHDDKCELLRMNQIATQLIALPFATSPDAHTIGLCIRRYAQSDTPEDVRTNG